MEEKSVFQVRLIFWNIQSINDEGATFLRNAAQCNIPEDQNPQHQHMEFSKQSNTSENNVLNWIIASQWKRYIM